MAIKKLNVYFLTILISTILTIFSSVCLCMTHNITTDTERIFTEELEKPEQLEKSMIIEVISYYNPKLTMQHKRMIGEAIYREAGLTGLDPFLITSVIAAESSFRPNAVSPCAARGLMQITAVVSNMMHVSNPFNIQQNIYAGTRYLKMLHQQFKKDDLVLAAYNAGPTRVARLKRVPNIRETVNYIKKVAKFQQELKVKLVNNINRLMKNSMFQMICKSSVLGEKQGCEQIGKIRANDIPQASIDLCEKRRELFFIIEA